MGFFLENAFQSRPHQTSARSVIFKKKENSNHPILSLKNIQDERESSQKHLGLILDEKRNFKQHIESAIVKTNKGVAVIKKLRYSLPRKSLITIYKAFLRPFIDYGVIIYDQPQNECLCEKLESAQYKAALPITGAIQGYSREKFYQELGLELLKSRRW